MRGVVGGENGIDHRFLRGRITILFEDSRTVCEGVPDWNVEFQGDRFQERPCGIHYRQKLILVKRGFRLCSGLRGDGTNKHKYGHTYA